MATTVTFPTASPHSLTLLITSDDGVAIGVPSATVLAACAEGPLKAALTRRTDWRGFNIDGTGVDCDRIHVRELVNRGAGPQPQTAEFFWEIGGIKVNCTIDAFQQLEIRAPHSSRA